MTVAVVVPWRGGCAHRERAWEWVQGRYAEQHPGWEVIEAPGPEPWSKGAAVNPVIEATNAEIVVVADADVWCDEIQRAVYEVAFGEAHWAVPHTSVHRLNAAGTDALLAGGEMPHQPLDRAVYDGLWGGGIVVAWREALLKAPLDLRFTGWGQEDAAWGLALYTLVGKGWRGNAGLTHLFHPPMPRLNRKQGSTESWQLYHRYRQARNDQTAMRKLIEEGRHVDHPPRQPALRAHFAVSG